MIIDKIWNRFKEINTPILLFFEDMVLTNKLMKFIKLIPDIPLQCLRV